MVTRDALCIAIDIFPDEVGKKKFLLPGLSLRIFRHSYCGRVVQKSHSSTPKFTRPHLERTKYVQASEAKP